MDTEEEETRSPILEFLRKKGTAWAFLLSVIVNCYIVFEALFRGKPEELLLHRWLYSAILLIVVLMAIGLYILGFYLDRRIGTRSGFQILEEIDELDLCEQGDGSRKVTITQKIRFRTLRSELHEFQTFYPLRGTPKGFICRFPEGDSLKLDSDDLQQHADGVGIDLKRPYAKGDKGNLPPITWEYVLRSSTDAIGTATIKRPTKSLELSVRLPPNLPKPVHCGWCVVTSEEFSQYQGSSGIKCDEYDNRYLIRKRFNEREIKEGFGYAIWWDFQN